MPDVDAVLARVSVSKILDEIDILEEDKEMLILRFVYEWYYEDIGLYIGMKYRGKAYGEGNIRYRLKKCLDSIREQLETSE